MSLWRRGLRRRLALGALGWALTAGVARDFSRFGGFEWAAGADVTGYHVPDALREAYGSHPVSFHVFLRVRPPAGHMGRMWNMVMAQPMR